MTEIAREPQRKPLPTKLFLETSAQIQRLAGSPDMRAGINLLVNADPKPAIGTSATVKREFDHICDGLFQKLDQAALNIPKQPASSLIPFEDLLLKIKAQVSRYHPGGEDFLLFVYTKLSAKFGGQLFTVNRARNVFDGFLTWLKLGFLQEEFFDKSSCGVWEPQGSCTCDSKPDGHCRLSEIVIENRENFLATATTLAGAKRDESPRLKKILNRLETTHGKPLLELLGKNKGHVADLIIFWEVPDGWTILSRDLTFKKLGPHRKAVDFFMVRIPRTRSDTQCKVFIDGMAEPVDGTLINHNESGARIHAPSITVKKKQRITVSSPEFQVDREGDVSEFDPKSKQDPPQANFGVKFIRKS